MKKAFGFILVNLAASAAFAWPTVGDTALYDVQLTGNVPMTGAYSLSTAAINAGTDEMMIHIMTDFHGAKSTQQTKVKLSDFQKLAQRLPEEQIYS